MKEPAKPLKYVIICLFAALLLGAVVFFKQRMLFLDAPHTLFRIINDNSIIITVGRYGSFITQLLPWLGAKIHLPLTLLMLLYSVSFNLFFLTIALLLIYKYHRTDLALLFAFYLTLITSDTYFWTNNEVHEGIAWLMLAFAINAFSSAHNRPLIILLPLFLITFYLAICTHPLVMIAAAYLWLFYWIKGDNWPYTRQQSVGYTILLVMIIAAKYYQSSHNWYDGDKMEVVKNIQLSKIITIYKAPQFKWFVNSCIHDYWLFSLIFIIGNLALLASKKYALFVLSIVFSFGYVILICLTYWDLHSLRFYIESEYMPLATIGAAPFIYFALPLLRKKQAAAVVAGLLFLRLTAIVWASPYFTARVALLEAVNQKMREKHITKALMPDNDKTVDSMLVMSWGLPVESIMLSKMDGDMPQNTIYIADTNSLNTLRNSGHDTLLASFEKRTMKNINSCYFSFDTSSPYKVITYTQLLR
jgi:hypothetical protein